MEALAQDEVRYAAGSYYSAGAAQSMPLPDVSFAIPMRERYFRPTVAKAKLATLPPAPSTLIGVTPQQMEALSADAFRACFTATPMRSLTREQLACIEKHAELRKIASEVL